MRSLSAFIELFKSPFSQQLRVVCSKTSWEWWRWILVYRDSTGRQFHYLFNQVLVNAPLIEDGNQVGSSTNTVEGGNVETNYVVINIYKQLASHTQITTECNSIHSLVVKYLPSKQMSWVRFPDKALFCTFAHPRRALLHIFIPAKDFLLVLSRLFNQKC